MTIADRFVLMLSLCALPLAAQKLTQEERTILRLQDQRSTGNGQLAAFLQSPKPRLRTMAAIAFANIQDTATIRDLIPSLRDQSISVRAAAALALGQIGTSRAQQPVFDALRMEKSPDVQSRLLEALGRIGTREMIDSIASYASGKRVLLPKRDLAMTMGRFALRGMKTEAGTWLCFDLLEIPQADVRWRAFFALWRMAPNGLNDVEIAKRSRVVKEAAMERSPDVRMHAAVLMGKSKAPEAKEILRSMLAEEMIRGDWRVLVQISRACAALLPANPDMMADLQRCLESKNPHVLIASLQAIAGLLPNTLDDSESSAAVHERIRQLASRDVDGADMVRGEALVALGRHDPEAMASAASLLTDPNVSIRLRTKIIEGLSQHISTSNYRLVLQYLDADSVRTAMAAWDFLKKIATPAGFQVLQRDTILWNDLPEAVLRKAERALELHDMAVTTVVANAFADSVFFALFQTAGKDGAVVAALNRAYDRLRSPDDVEAMQAILEAFAILKDRRSIPAVEKGLSDADRTVNSRAVLAWKQITGNSPAEPKQTGSKPWDDSIWETIESISRDQMVEMTTTKGTLRIRLARDDAPFTVASLVKLVRKGFYNGLSIHRVVPNFVVQGGDPRGDGWGGPGYAIRTEISMLRFEDGSCGIASAGKDTEGCQFFIMHSAAPHLDGRYTVFGRVVSGREVVDRLQVGDRVISMHLTEK